jgi:hypothetical protein
MSDFAMSDFFNATFHFLFLIFFALISIATIKHRCVALFNCINSIEPI